MLAQANEVNEFDSRERTPGGLAEPEFPISPTHCVASVSIPCCRSLYSSMA
jgi:hypothetical protein